MKQVRKKCALCHRIIDDEAPIEIDSNDGKASKYYHDGCYHKKKNMS